jgi:uncharacterized protein YfeS
MLGAPTHDREAVIVERDDMRELERAVSQVAVGQAQIIGKVDVLATKLEANHLAIETRVKKLEDINVEADTRQWVEKLLWAAVGALGGGGAVAGFLQSFHRVP